MLSSIKNWVAAYRNHWKKIIEQKDVSSILDQLLLFSIIFGALFIAAYRITTYIESNYLGSTNIRLPLGIRHNLAFAFFLFISFWSAVKYFVRENYEKKKEIFKVVPESDKASFALFGKKFEFKTANLFIVAVLAVILGSILIKLPYWNLPFVGSHPIKYNTYAEPAQHMYERGDPLYFKRHYMYDPIKGTQESSKYFGNFPFLEWCLYVGYSLLGNQFSIEFITRLVMALLGGAALASLYLFTSRVTNKKIALATIALFALNPIFNMASYVTVYDMVTFSAAFFSLSLVVDYLKSRKNSAKYLALAGLIVGIGSSIKVNVAIWVLPTVLVLLMLDRKESFKEKIGEYLYYTMWLFAPLIVTYTSLAWFPSKEPGYFVLFVVWLLALGFIYSTRERVLKTIKAITSWKIDILSRFKWIWFLILLAFVAGIYLLYQTYVAKEFLTDLNLIVNFELYNRLISVQLIPYSGMFVALIFLFCIPMVMTEKDRVLRKYLLAIFLGSLAYFVFAAKALFFHSYYWLVILGTIYLFVSVGIFRIAGEVIRSTFIRAVFLFAFFGVLAVSLFFSSVGKINRDDPDIGKLAQYFATRVEDDRTSYIDQATTTYIIFKTKLNMIYSYEVFDTDEFRDAVKEMGFVGAMEHFRILYLIVPTGGIPDYLPIANGLDFDHELEPYALRRTAKIEDYLYGVTNYYPDTSKRLELLKEHDVAGSFRIAKEIGKYTVYELCLDCKEPAE